MHRTTRILAGLIVDGVMGRKGAAQRDEGFPFIAPQMSIGIAGFCKNPIRFGLGQILDYRGLPLTKSADRT